MNRSAKALASKVAAGTVNMVDTPAEMRAFKEAARLLGWEGVRGGGVVNHIEGARVKSWATLAGILVNEAEETAANGAESAARTLDQSAAFQAVQSVASRVPLDVVAEGQEEIRFVYWYTTRVPTVPLTDNTSVDAVVTEEVEGGAPEGKCQSGAALDCAEWGFLRILPESMLPGQEREQMIQCLPCYEASAAAYVRKLHGRA